MKSRSRSSAIAACLLAAALTVSSTTSVVRADATADELTAARENFKQGIELEKAGKFAEALEKFEATAKVKSTAQVRFHIGLCNEKLGHLGAAIEASDAAAKQAEAEGNAPEVLKVAPGLAEKLRGERAKVTVVFTGTAAPDRLEIDGKVVEGKVAKDYIVDPGPHVVIASVGEKENRMEFAIERGESRTLTIDLGDSGSEPTYEHPAEHPRDVPVASAKPGSARRTIAWTVGGFGVVSLALAGAFYVVRVCALDELEDACTDLRCPPSSKTSYDRAKTFTTLSGVALGVGVAAVSVGAVMLLTGKPPSEQPKTARFVPYAPNADLLGFGIEGAF